MTYCFLGYKVTVDTLRMEHKLNQKNARHSPNGTNYSPSFLIQYQETVASLSEKADVGDVKQFYNLLTASMDVISKWAESIPGFTAFCSEDQELLLKSAFVELFILRLAYR